MPQSHILVVDDEPDILDLVTMVLTDAGFAVRSATSAAAALEDIRRHRPGVVLLDLQLPGVSGLEVARQLRADPVTSDIPLIAHSAHASTGDEASALAAGFVAYITKPSSVRGLIDTIQRYAPTAGKAPPKPKRK